MRNVFRITANVKRLGFCGVYAQSFFHAIEPNQCYTKKFFNSAMRAESEQLNIKIMKTILTGKKKEISEKLKKIDLENLINKQKFILQETGLNIGDVVICEFKYCIRGRKPSELDYRYSINEGTIIINENGEIKVKSNEKLTQPIFKTNGLSFRSRRDWYEFQKKDTYANLMAIIEK